MFHFEKELEQGAIHFRDDLQFELKSEFTPVSTLKENIYTQEFYLFIPSALRINKQTYSDDHFYRDQTNFIRYKTPEFSLKDLISEERMRSPLNRIIALAHELPSEENLALVGRELKLFGNIMRSTIRNQIRDFLRRKKAIGTDQEEVSLFLQDVNEFVKDIDRIRKRFSEEMEPMLKRWKGTSFQRGFEYVDEFISNAIDFYLTGFLNELRREQNEDFLALDRSLCELLVKEKQLRERRYPPLPRENDEEFILYRRGLLNKFVLDALFLKLKRTAPAQKYSHFIGATAAGIAMFLYIALLAWQGGGFAINSLSFIILTVVLYILKDRVKEGLKLFYFRQAMRWFPDFVTEIRTPDNARKIGELKESFSIINQTEVPQEFIKIRNTEFHTDLEMFTRPETVLYYKKELLLERIQRDKKTRRNKLNTIFRFNIHHFLEKASNPYHEYIALDSDSCELIRRNVPKVYHINMIVKDTYTKQNLKKKLHIKKFRLVVDKNGIKRVEQVKVNR